MTLMKRWNFFFAKFITSQTLFHIQNDKINTFANFREFFSRNYVFYSLYLFSLNAVLKTT